MTVLDPVILFLLSWRKKSISLEQVMKGADRPRKPVLRVMDRLVREGYLVEAKDDKVPPGYGECGRPLRNPTWQFTGKQLARRPQPKPQKRTVRDRLWKIIRAKRRFTRSDIEIVTGVKRASIEDYTKLLEREGILRVIGKNSWEKVYLLVKDSGPQRPIIKEVTHG